MAKSSSRQKDSKLKELLIIAFVMICFTLIFADVGNNLLQELSQVKK